MPETVERITDLILKFMKNDLSSNEKRDLDEWIAASESNKRLFEKLSDTDVFNKNLQEIFEYKQKAWGMISESLFLNPSPKERGLQQSVVRKMFPWKRVAVAASIILVLGVGSYFLFFNKTKQVEVAKTQEERFKDDVLAPKTTKAMITLADGRKVLLGSVTSGTLATQGNVKVAKNAKGEIIYSSESAVRSQEMQYNTLFNPRGSKVQSLTLSDGTKIWLNSESSLKYPVAFAGSERKVEITGEAYFEVTHDASKKFIVESNGVSTEVVGTHFNVNSYSDEGNIKVTLLEGSVVVSRESSVVKIKPGEQVVAADNEQLRTNKDVDLEEVMAWKNGRFELNGNVQGIMKQISRWYDVDIEYSGNVTNKRFGGTLSREENVSGVLKYLELTGTIHFKIEGKKVVVMP